MLQVVFKQRRKLERTDLRQAIIRHAINSICLAPRPYVTITNLHLDFFFNFCVVVLFDRRVAAIWFLDPHQKTTILIGKLTADLYNDPSTPQVMVSMTKTISFLYKLTVSISSGFLSLWFRTKVAGFFCAQTNRQFSKRFHCFWKWFMDT